MTRDERQNRGLEIERQFQEIAEDDKHGAAEGADDEFAGRSHDDLYRWATSLIWPYLEIGEGPTSDPATADARRMWGCSPTSPWPS